MSLSVFSFELMPTSTQNVYIGTRLTKNAKITNKKFNFWKLPIHFGVAAAHICMQNSESIISTCSIQKSTKAHFLPAVSTKIKVSEGNFLLVVSFKLAQTLKVWPQELNLGDLSQQSTVLTFLLVQPLQDGWFLLGGCRKNYLSSCQSF